MTTQKYLLFKNIEGLNYFDSAFYHLVVQVHNENSKTLTIEGL